MTSAQVLLSRTASGPSATSVGTSTLAMFLLAGYIVCMPIQIDTQGGGFRFAPSDIFLILYVLCTGASLRWLRPRVWNIWHILIPSIFAMSLIVSLLRTGVVTRYALFNKSLGVLSLLVTYGMLTAEATSWARIRQILRLFVWSTVVINTLALAAFLDFAPFLAEHVFTFSYTGRLSGMLIDPNAYGGLLAVAFAVHATTYLSDRPLTGGVAGMLITASLLTGILYTYSRSTWISVALMIVVLSTMRPKIGMAIVAVIALTVVGVVAVVPSASLNHMMFMAERPDQVDSRINAAVYAFPQFLEHPVFGIGLGVFQEEYGNIIHNTLLWFLVEFGIVGLSVFVGFYIYTLLHGLSILRRVRREHRELILGLIVAHVAILGLSMGIEAFYQRHWWLAISMLASAGVLTRSESAADQARYRR